jgi:hypothetical protein
MVSDQDAVEIYMHMYCAWLLTPRLQVTFDLSSSADGLSTAVVNGAVGTDGSIVPSDRHCAQRADVGVAHQQALFRSPSRVVLTSAESTSAEHDLPSRVVSMILALQNETSEQLGVPPKGVGARPTQSASACGAKQELQRTSTARIGQQSEPDTLASSSPEQQLRRTSTLRIGQPVQVEREIVPTLEQCVSEPNLFKVVLESEPQLERTSTIRIGQQRLSPQRGEAVGTVFRHSWNMRRIHHRLI